MQVRTSLSNSRGAVEESHSLGMLRDPPPLSGPLCQDQYWSAISWPRTGRNLCVRAAATSQPPVPFRRSKRRSGRIPAEPYPPFEFLHCSASHSGPKALNPRGSGTASPTSTMLRSLWIVRSLWSSPSQIDRRRRLVGEALVRPFLVVESEILFDPGPCFRHRLVGFQVHLLVFERSPQPLDENVVHAASPSVHADADLDRKSTRLNSSHLGISYAVF